MGAAPSGRRLVGTAALALLALLALPVPAGSSPSASRFAASAASSLVALALAASSAAPAAGEEGSASAADAPQGWSADAGDAFKSPAGLAEARAMGWAPDDPVEVYYTEFLLAQWVLDKSPWNAYHSAIAFTNNRTDEKVVFDFSPEDVSSVMNMVVPGVASESPLQAVMGDYRLVWKNKAMTQFYNRWPSKYSNFVRLGHLNGTVFDRFVDWVETSYAPSFSEFQPLEVAVEGSGNVVRSRMCHDFVTDALWALYNDSVKLEAKEAIFRDHVILYASSFDVVDLQASSTRDHRRQLRFFRVLELYMEEIKEQFTHARAALLAGFKLGIPVFLHNEHQEFRVHLVPPFLNYCYLPLAIPPKVHNPFAAMKLCALGLQANLTNSTGPIPWGPMLAIEERLDRLEVPLALLLVALAATWGSAGGGGRGGTPSEKRPSASVTGR